MVQTLTMKILISNAPPEANKESLRTLVRRIRMLHWLSYLVGAPPELVQCRVVRIARPERPETQATRYYGILVVHPEKATEKLIKQLNGKKLNDRAIEARQYHDRTPTDRRWVPTSTVDNRRKRLIIETLIDRGVI